MRLAILASHPIQYQAPLFRELARRLDLVAFFAHRADHADQAAAGFGVGFAWDIDLLSGYEHCFLPNVSREPGLHHFGGCDTPSIGAELAQGGFDALLVMGWHLKAFLQGIWAARRSRLPVLVRGDSQLETPRSALKRLGKACIYPAALRIFDAALYVGSRSRDYWRHYGFPEARLIFSPHCVDNEWFARGATRDARQELRARHGIPGGAKVGLFAGKLVPPKRPLDLIAAGALLSGSFQDFTVLVAGAGPLEGEMRSVAAASGVRLVPLGFCNQTAMPQAYAAADVLVLPSGGEETWGLVANEALACGRPIVVSDSCGCSPDLAGDGLAGRVFQTGNVARLAHALAHVLAEPPNEAVIAAKVAGYSLAAAVEGISRAAEMVTAPQRGA